MRVPPEERVPNTEFRAIRKRLGMSKLDMAEYLYVRERSVLHWEEGRYPPPPGVMIELEALEEFTAAMAEAARAKMAVLRQQYLDDGDFDFDRLSARWWQQVCQRAGLEPDGDLSVKRSRLPEPGIPRV